MIGLVMAGGRGSRMKIDGEKLLLLHKKPLVMHVIDALNAAACLERVLVAVSKNSPKTRQYLLEKGVHVIETSGLGYAEDLTGVLQQVRDPILVVSGDLPLLDAKIVRDIAARYDPRKQWTSFLVTGEFLRSIGIASGLSVTAGGQDCVYTGVSLVNAKGIVGAGRVEEHYVVLNDKRIAFNLNTKQDYELLGTS